MSLFNKQGPLRRQRERRHLKTKLRVSAIILDYSMWFASINVHKPSTQQLNCNKRFGDRNLETCRKVFRSCIPLQNRSFHCRDEENWQTLVKAFKTKVFIARVFTSSFSGRSVTDNRKSRENSCFSSSLIQIDVLARAFSSFNLLVKKRIICLSLKEVCKLTTFRN